jgi:hypothetical protein
MVSFFGIEHKMWRLPRFLTYIPVGVLGSRW